VTEVSSDHLISCRRAPPAFTIELVRASGMRSTARASSMQGRWAGAGAWAARACPSHTVSAWPTSGLTWHPVRKRSRTLDSRTARPRWTSPWVAWVSPSVPAGRTTPAVAAPPVEAAPVPAGAAPPAAVPTIPVASPTELDRLRKPKMIGGVMQAQWSSDNAGVRATAGRRHDRRSSHQGEHPYNRFLHAFLLAFSAISTPRERAD
jgi:hypothetical protein